jgi:hypothetical protein
MGMDFRVTLCSIFTAAMLLFNQQAVAQDDASRQLKAKAEAIANQVRSACQDDLKNYCSSVTAGEARIAFCMLAHEDKISDKCVEGVLATVDEIELKMSKLARMAVACEQDIKKKCTEERTGNARLIQCLSNQREQLSPLCQAELGK